MPCAASNEVSQLSAAESLNAIDGHREIFAGGIAGFLAAMVVPIVAGPLIYAPTAPGLLIVALIAAAIIACHGDPGCGLGLSGQFAGDSGGRALDQFACRRRDWLSGRGRHAVVAGGLSLNLTLSARASFVITLSRPKLLAAWLGMFAIVAACYATAYHPTVVAQAEIAGVHHDPRPAEELLTRAAAADRFAAEPWVELAEVRFATCAPCRQRSDSRRSKRPKPRRWHGALRKVVCTSAWPSIISKRSRGPAIRGCRGSLAAARRAVELYPNHARERRGWRLSTRPSGAMFKMPRARPKGAARARRRDPACRPETTRFVAAQLLPLIESAK